MCSPIRTISILSKLPGMDRNSAKRLVHLSRTWADQREQFDTLHELAEQATVPISRDEDSS